MSLADLILGRRELDDQAVPQGAAHPVEMPTAVLPRVDVDVPEYVGRHRAGVDRPAYESDRSAVRSHRRTRGGAAR